MKREELKPGTWYMLDQEKVFFIGFRNNNIPLVDTPMCLRTLDADEVNRLMLCPRTVIINDEEVEPPEWAVGYAMDENGSYWWYEYKPSLHAFSDAFVSSNGMEEPVTFKNWRNSWTEI